MLFYEFHLQGASFSDLFGNHILCTKTNGLINRGRRWKATPCNFQMMACCACD